MKLDVQRLLFIGVLIILVYLMVPPLFFTGRASLYVAEGFAPARFSLQNYINVLSTPDTPTMMRNSLVFATGSSLIAIVLGTLLAWIVERTNTPLKNLAYLSAFTTFAVPGIMKVIGWILILGPEAGMLNMCLKGLLGLKNSPLNIFTMLGMILVEAVVWTPVVFLFMAAPFRSMDPSLEESAALAGAGVGKTFYHITFKLALPSVLSVLLLNFVRALEAFEIPALVGIPAGIMVLTSEIYIKMRTGLLPDYGLASAYAIILIFLVVTGLYFYARTTREAQKFYTITGKGFRPRVLNLGKWRYMTTILIFLLPTFLILPLLALLWASFLPFYSVPSVKVLSTLTVANYLKVSQNPIALGALKNSLLISLFSATGAMLLTAVTAWIVIRTNIRGKWLLDHLASFPLAFPGIVLGVALLVTYLSLPIPLYGTIWIMVVAYITAYIPYGIRFCYPGLLQINKELEESAQMSGASWGIVFRKIVVPLMMPSLFAGWIYIFLHTVKALGSAVLLSKPGTEVVAVLIFDMWQDGMLPEIGAFGISLVFILVALAGAFYKLSTRYGLRIEH